MQNNKFEVLNSYGQSVESGVITQETSSCNLNLTSMPAGVYTFILYTNNSNQSQAKIKLVKL
jgi:hypothetical protein